ncbi:hypothetical protein BDZ85DRAFT_263057 [Elsinoe ampelina]|uniref:Secreted protein n=1 Tax=Elsinoe ampelina TaxID=302913 RepID=A0A6A6GBZ0_9PEZI|nr:hypothetical protein BDZ85DRAFT_263057 [Elsinoe ampelina]
MFARLVLRLLTSSLSGSSPFSIRSHRRDTSFATSEVGPTETEVMDSSVPREKFIPSDRCKQPNLPAQWSTEAIVSSFMSIFEPLIATGTNIRKARALPYLFLRCKQ